MQIMNLEKQTGLERATIRYYEREGLLTPQRQENGYRSYSDGDVQTLLKIKLLRQLGMSLEQIRSLQQGSEALSPALEKHIAFLDQQIRQGERSREICREIQSTSGDYRSLDAAYYLERLDRPSLQTPTPPKFQEYVPREYHPVRRFAARMVDFALLHSLISFLLIVLLRIRPYSNFLSWVVYFGSLILMVPLEAAALSLWGTTPGKWALGLSLCSCNGNKLRFSQGLEREWKVLREGLGYGIPGLRLWRLWKRYREYQSLPDMDWDWECEYSYRDLSIKNRVVFAALICLSILFTAVSAEDSIRPRYRGDHLTVAQFASNYNFYVYTLSEEVEQGKLLQKDGSAYPAQERNVIYLGGQPEEENTRFSYGTEEGYLRKITYTNCWKDVNFCSTLPDACQTAVCTMFFSRGGCNVRDWKAFVARWEEAMEAGETEGSLRWENMELHWVYTLENCQIVNGGKLCINVDDASDSSMTICFEIRILPESNS